ncbi:MAG: SusC/RagA family TonB-linked outer membrane protein [Dysgonomonas sp.]|uniref:SusC/RagA family TonB-linked outer membrane protein n=1 Tax=Dysgonomonas sp. TaxID=1891233 RepID=UPI003A8B1F81
MKVNLTKPNRKAILILFFLLGISMLNAQNKATSITGVVKDESGETVIGATIKVKGTSTGTVTDMDGKFFLETPATGILSISYIGYQPVEMAIESNKHYTITLKEDQKQLDEVVVTALGIKREEKGLGFATENIEGQSLNDSKSNNWATALSGKVAGLSIISPGGGPLGTSRISLRGDNSMNMDGNNALIVIDGVPIGGSATGTGADSYGAGSGSDIPVDYGDAVSDLNPEDIESITVLKGASAAALYGSRAANGALIITTKSGSKQKGIGVTFSSNFSIDNVLKWPDYQYEYGQGTQAKDKNGNWYYSYGASADGTNTGSTSSAFGPKFDGQMYFQYDPNVEGQSLERQLWQPYKNNIKDFWRTGTNFTNSISIEGASDKASFRASLTHQNNEWMMPNTGFKRTSVSTSFDYKITNKLRFSSKVSFTNRNSDNLPGTGYNNQSISYFMIFQNPNVDLAWYRPIWKKDKDQVEQIHPFSSYIDNPYLIAYEMENPTDKNSVLGTASATYQFSRKFDLLVRTGIEMSHEAREQHRPYNTANFATGYYKEEDINYFEINTDFLFSYREQFNRDLGLRVSAGGNMRKSEYRYKAGYITGLVTPGVYKLSNGFTSATMRSTNRDKQVNSLYGTATINYKKFLYLDVTGRNDWSSTLPIENNSFFYPSVSGSFVLSDVVKMPSQISFTKLRLSWAQVGNDTDPYKTAKYYSVSEFSGAAERPGTLYNANLKPEISTNYEAGIDFRMFKNRLGIDITGYRNYTKNQIIDVPIDPTAGYGKATINAGKVRNQGLEIVLNGLLMEQRSFKWKASFNWAKNWNRIMELSEDLDNDEDQMIAQAGTVYYYAKVGGSMGDMYGYKLLRNPEGKVIYDAATGLTAKPENVEYVGNAYPGWKAGLQNEFTIKNVRVSFSIDGQYGGLVYSQSHHKMTEQGKLKHTLYGRDSEDGKLVGDGVVANGDGTYSPNTTRVLVSQYYADYYRRANVETNSFDATFIKLREARVEYNFPSSITKKLKLNSLAVALFGRNLWMWTKEYPLFDPEAAALNSSTIVPGTEMGQMPSSRTMGINLNVKF